MGKYSKKRSVQHNRRVVGCIVLVVVFVLLLSALVLTKVMKDSADPAEGESQVKELVVQDVTAQGDTVLVTTTYGTVKYPFAFSDVMGVEAETFEKHAVLTFSMVIDGAVVKLYSLHFNGTEGIPVGTLEVDGDTFAVTSQFYEAKNISDNGMATFYAAQETFNDVLISLSENEGFTVAD